MTMKTWSVCLAVGLLVGGCAGQARRPPPTEVTRIPDRGDWFCQLDASGQGWQCVQDPDLAENPQPERFPEPAPQQPELSLPGAPDAAAPGPDERALAPESSELPPTAPQRAAAPQRPAGEQPAAAAEPASAPAPPADRRPDSARLAYQPAQPVALADLPGTFYAVQVLAMNTRAQLDAFVRRHDISGLSSARVERNGAVYYVLLLGIYETLERARQAAAGLPPALAGVDPWIRSVSSLQAAMRRAEALTRSTEST